MPGTADSGIVAAWLRRRIVSRWSWSRRTSASCERPGRDPRAAVPFPGFLGHAPRDHRIECSGNSGAQLARLRNRLHQVRGDDDAHAVGLAGL